MGSPVEQRASAVLRRLPRQANVAEVGVLDGRMSALLLAKSDCRLTMVDNWLCGDEQPESYKSTRDAHAFDTAQQMAAYRKAAYAVAGKHAGRTTVMRASSLEAAHTAPDGAYEMVFVDADHSYEAVRADIEAWLPKLRPGGWIGGHDIDNPAAGYDFTGVRRAVEEAFGEVELDANFTWFWRAR